MGARGPAPTPTKILEGRGSWRAKSRKATRADVAAPPCPAWLKGEARAEWDRQTKELIPMGVLARTDRGALAIWCCAWAEYCAVTAELAGKKPWAKGNSRLVWIRKAAIDTLLKVAAQFGFTPAARARLTTSDDAPPASDPMEAFFSRSRN